MSALARCSRYSRLFSRSFQSYSRITAKNYLDEKKNLFCTLTRLTQRQSLTNRSYTVVSGDKSSLKYDDEVKSSEETLSSTRYSGDRHEILQYPENYPASPFWKNYDFNLGNKDFSSVCKDMYEEVFGRKYVVLDKFYEFMAYVQQKDSFTEDELLLIFKSLGLENKEVSDADRAKWVEYLLERFHSLGVQLTTAHYNEVLKIYNFANHKFSPVEFLSDMEKHGASPNVITLSRMVVIYCKLGDIKSASNILDHMRKAQMTVNSVMYRNLIIGNFIAGDKETGLKLFRNCSDLGFSMDTQMYEAVITGYAMVGDLDGVKKMMEEAEENVVMLPTIISLILQKVVPEGHKHIIEFATSKPANTYDWPLVYLGRAIKIMMEYGHHDLAFRYFASVPEGVSLLYHKALETGMDIENVVKYVEMLKQLGMSNATYSYYFILAVSKFRYETAISVLPHVVTEGTMRPQFIWPLIQYCKIMKDPEEMKKIIPYIETNDFVSVTSWLEPALSSLGVGLEEIHGILKNHSKFNEGQINALMVFFELRDKGWEQAARYAESCEEIEDIKDYFGSLLGHNMMISDHKKDWRSILDVYSVSKNCRVNLIWSLQKTVDHQELKDYILKKDITVYERNLQDNFKSLFTEEERDKVIRRTYTNEEIMNMEYEELLELQDTLGTTLSYCFRLLNKSFFQKDWDVFRKTLTKIPLEPSKIKSQIALLQMAYFSAVVEDQIDSCRKYIDAIQSREDLTVYHQDVLKIGAKLCEKGMFHDALRLLRKFKCEQFVFVDHDVIQRNTFFNMKPTSENIKIAKEMMNVLDDNGYFTNKALRNSCTKAFWNLISESENVKEVREAFDYLFQTFKYIPKQYVAVLSNYFKRGDKDGLQTVYDKLTEVAQEQNVLLSLTAAFIENGEMLKAKKVLATPGMRVSKINVEEIMSRWARNGQPQFMEVFSNLCSSLPSDIDQASMKSLQLQAMCNMENPDVDACIQFFERHFENEEESVADLDTLKCYGRFLKKHRPEKVLDHYVMDFINAEDAMERKMMETKRRNIKSRKNEEKQTSNKKSQEKLKELTEDVNELTVEKKFKKLLIDRKFDEAVQICQELTDKEIEENLPKLAVVSKFVRYLYHNNHKDIMNRIPQEQVDSAVKGVLKQTRSHRYPISACKLILEKQPQLLMTGVENLPSESKINALCASLYLNDTDKVKELCKVVKPDSDIILGVFEKSLNRDFQMELPEIRNQLFAILDSELGESEKALAYSCTMKRLHKTNDTEGVELLAEKAKSTGLSFEEIRKLLKENKTEFVEILCQLEKSFEEQNKSLPWASTNTWTIDISNETVTKSDSLAEKNPSDLIPEEEHPSNLIPEEEHHTEVIVAEEEHVDITMKPDEHTEIYELKKEADQMVDRAETVSDKNEPEMKDNAKVISDDSSKGS